jgi:hypothetical protein
MSVKKHEPKLIEEPPDEFRRWWNPVRSDKKLGGSIGGHDHCLKLMQNQFGQWGWSSGITATKAWQMQCYRDEWADSKSDHAEPGTGVNYAYYGWHNPFPPPRTSNPTFVEAHRAWCKAHNKPDPLAEADKMPDDVRNAKDFTDVKDAVRSLSAKMDMNRAIGWTQEDSDAANQANDPF